MLALLVIENITASLPLLSEITSLGAEQEGIEIFCSSKLTCLQETAEAQQKWPLLNLVRQVLKACSYKLDPIRKSDGYTKDGKKKYKRYFIIKKLKEVDTKEMKTTLTEYLANSQKEENINLLTLYLLQYFNNVLIPSTLFL